MSQLVSTSVKKVRPSVSQCFVRVSEESYRVAWRGQTCAITRGKGFRLPRTVMIMSYTGFIEMKYNSQGIQYGNSFGSNGRIAGRMLNFQMRHVPNVKEMARMTFSEDAPASSSCFKLDISSSRDFCERKENMRRREFKLEKIL